MSEQIYDSVLDLVGNTPLVRVNRLARAHGLQCELIVKLEYMNPGGSIKDRIAKNMLLEAEKSGLLKPGDTLVEPTSGNTGIGIAMAAAAKGYKCVLSMQQKMSNEKVCTLKAMGCQVVRTPNAAAFDSPESHFGVARELVKANPTTHHQLDQYSNPSNPAAHVKGTAEEIFRQTGGRLDMIVMSVGTGGTMSGTGKRLKELIPNLKVVAVDPDGSVLHDDSIKGRPWSVEGIGQINMVPKVLDRSVPDEWVITGDAESYQMARQLIREEGVLCGGSSGAAIAGAIKAAKKLGPDQRCLVILPDGIRNYLTRFLDDEWMVANGFAEQPVTSPVDPILSTVSPEQVTLDTPQKQVPDCIYTPEKMATQPTFVVDPTSPPRRLTEDFSTERSTSSGSDTPPELSIAHGATWESPDKRQPLYFSIGKGPHVVARQRAYSLDRSPQLPPLPSVHHPAYLAQRLPVKATGAPASNLRPRLH